MSLRALIPPLLAAALFSVLLCLPSANAASKKEHFVKVAFLYNFTKFLEWPQVSNSLRICVNGSADFMEAARAIEKRSTQSKQYNVIFKPRDYSVCHIVYYEEPGAFKPNMLVDVNGQKISALTVGNSEDFITQGGMISFVLVDNKIKLIVNLKEVQKAGLQMSSQLLEVAHKVIQGE